MIFTTISQNTILVLLGLGVGVFTNKIKPFGNVVLNFIFATAITTLQGLLEYLGRGDLIPLPVLIFIYAYLLGTFAPKLMTYAPIPIIKSIGKALG